MNRTLLTIAGAAISLAFLAGCATSAQQNPQTAAGVMGCQMGKDMQCSMMADMKDRMSVMQQKMQMCRDMMTACAEGRPCEMDKMMKDMGDMHGMMGMMMQQMKSMPQERKSPTASQDDHSAHHPDAPK